MPKTSRLLIVILSATLSKSALAQVQTSPATAPAAQPAPAKPATASKTSGTSATSKTDPTAPGQAIVSPAPLVKPGPSASDAAPVKSADVTPAKAAEVKPSDVKAPVNAPDAQTIPEAIAPASTRKQLVADLTTCAKSLVPLADGYKRAYEDLEQWVAEVNSRTADVESRIQKLDEEYQKNENEIARLKAGSDKDARVRIKELTRTDKQVWKDLKAARKERTALSRDFAKTTDRKIKEYNADIAERFKTSQSEMR